ncbi:hypothetical protein ACEE49_09170 [[Pasteurella] aerogenes]|nr:hypothetical protein [[Pasteurella] aerogenes]MDY4478525.1 hypothetical protein [[Pasteurella] aerogenes]VEG70372.1 Uncharacterised protein [[Pasteurella] aerogenes]
MSSPFDIALAQADSAIERTIMSAYAINGVFYQAVFDEIPKEMNQIGSSQQFALSGSYCTLSLFKSQGYMPKRGDAVLIKGKEYVVTGYGYQDEILILQLE